MSTQPVEAPTTSEQILQSLSSVGEFLAEGAESAKDIVVNKFSEASEFIQANVGDAAYSFHESECNDPNATPIERMAARTHMNADALEATHHRTEAEYHKEMANNSAQAVSLQLQEGMESIGESLSHTGEYLSQTATDATHAVEETLSNASQFLSETALNARMAVNEQAEIASRELKEGMDAAGQSLADASDYLAQTAADATLAVEETLTNAGRFLSETVSNAGQYLAETAASAKDTIVNKTNETSEFLQAKKADAAYEIHKVQAENPMASVPDQVVARNKMNQDALESAQHKVAQASYKGGALINGEFVEDLPTRDTAADKLNETKETLAQRKADVDYSIHKAQAKDSNAPIGDRMAAGVSMVGDAIQSAQHQGAKNYYKNI